MRFASQPYIEGGLPIADTVSLVTSNLAAGNWRGALHSTYAPESASPEERRKLSNRLGLTGTFLEPIVNIATNPMTIIGAILTWKFGLPALRDAVTSEAGVAGLKKTLPFLEKLSGPRVIFGGTSIPDDLEHAAFRFKDYMLKFNERVLGAWEKGGYGKGVVPDESTLLRISAKLDGIDSDAASNPQARRMWSILREQLGSSPEKLGYTKGEAEVLRSKLWTSSGSPISITLSDSEHKVMEGLRDVFRSTYEEVISKAGDDADEYLHALGFARGNTKNLNKLEWYWPHLNRSTFIERQRSLDEMIRAKFGDISPERLAAERLKFQGKDRPSGIETQLMGSGKYKFAQRTGWLMPDPEDLRTLGVDDDLVELVRRHNHVNNNGLSYTLKPKEVLERYADSVSRVHSFLLPTAPGASSIADRISENIAALHDMGGVGRQKAKLLQSTYVPLALGRMTPGQLHAAEVWETTKLQAMEALEGPLTGLLGADTTKRFKDAILNDRSTSLPALGSSITKWFHLSALGGSVTAAIQNLSQFVWTASTLGGKYTAKGYNYILERAPELLSLSSKVGSSEAIAKVFPEFHAAHMEWDAVARRELEEIVDSTLLKSSSMKGKVESVKDWAETHLMAMFTASETTNRMGAFYGALQKSKDGFKLAIKDGNPIRRYNPIIGAAETVTGDKVLPHAIDEARIAVSRSQFGGGYLDRPAATTGWWAPLRQFTTFPLRTAGLMINEGLGAGNMGLVGRGLLASGLTYSVAREFLGQDVSGGILSGAVPTPTEGQPFSPLPVPPIVSLVGGGIQALQGDPSSLAKRLPMLVPGGVAASKMVGYLPGGSVTAPAIGKEYADYDHMTPDGRVAVYDPNGSLKGYATVGELAVRALGFSTPTSTQEQEFMKMVLGNRERIRNMKRDYLQALYEGDANHAQSIATAYDAAYPGTGGIPVSQSDITSLHRRRDVARSERVLESLPAPLRSQFAGVLGTVAGANTDAFLGMGGGGLGSGATITAREPMRAHPLSKTKEEMGTSQHGVKLSEKLKAAGLDAPRSRGTFGDFGAFTGF